MYEYYLYFQLYSTASAFVLLLIMFPLWLWETPFYHHVWTPLKPSNHFFGGGHETSNHLDFAFWFLWHWRCSKMPCNFHGQKYYYTLMCFSPSPSRCLLEKSIVHLVYPWELGVFFAFLASLLLISKLGNMCVFINSPSRYIYVIWICMYIFVYNHLYMVHTTVSYSF